PVDLGVRPAGQGDPGPQQHVAGPEAGDVDVLDADVFLPVQDRGLHLCSQAPHLVASDVSWTTTFSTPAAGRAASATASGALSRGKRCVTSSRTRTSRPKTSR